jgi:predicted nuclease with TOPRIM domain
MDFDKITRKFLLGEWKKGASVLSRARAIKEALENLKPRTIKDIQRIELALENLTHLRRGYRKLEEQNKTLTEENQQLTEKLQILEESRGDE